MSRRLLAALLVASALALPLPAAAADRVRVFSLQGLDGGDTGDQLAARLLSVSGVHGAHFDLYACELKLTLGTMITDARVTQLVSQAGEGWRAIPGPGRGRYRPPLEYPRGVDVAVLTRDGAALGPLEKLRVRGKVTIFDTYADWCVACRPMDQHVREFVRTHPHVAVRKLNLARWDSPLAREFGPRLTALPHVVVFTPDGRRREFDGATWEQVAATMGWR